MICKLRKKKRSRPRSKSDCKVHGGLVCRLSLTGSWRTAASAPACSVLSPVKAVLLPPNNDLDPESGWLRIGDLFCRNRARCRPQRIKSLRGQFVMFNCESDDEYCSPVQLNRHRSRFKIFKAIDLHSDTHSKMVLKIRLARFGVKRQPSYNIVLTQARYISNFAINSRHIY